MASSHADARALRLAAAVAVCLVLPLLLLLPTNAAAEVDNYWNGVWNTHHKGTHLMVLNLDQQQGDRTVTGTYKHPHDMNGDKGKIVAEAAGEFGKKLKGTYRSRQGGGRGGFKLHLLGNLNSFDGEFWPCRYRWYCSTFDWKGAQPGFE